MRLLWIVVLVLGCRGALFPPPPVFMATPLVIVVVQAAPVVPAPVGRRCYDARGVMNILVPEPCDCDGFPCGYGMPWPTRR